MLVLVLGAAAVRGGWAAARCAAVSSVSAGEPLACGAALDQERLWKTVNCSHQTSPRDAVVDSAGRSASEECFERAQRTLARVAGLNCDGLGQTTGRGFCSRSDRPLLASSEASLPWSHPSSRQGPVHNGTALARFPGSARAHRGTTPRASSSLPAPQRVPACEHHSAAEAWDSRMDRYVVNTRTPPASSIGGGAAKTLRQSN